MKFNTSPAVAGWLGAFLMLLSGCTTSGLNFSMLSQKHEKASPENPVEQIIPVWHEGEGPGTDQHTVSRGFAGQLYFITSNRGLPSEVEGKIRIYLFDDQGGPDELEKPIHQFDYDASTWKSHLTMTKLGPAYSVFVPYTRPGRPMAECALRIRFTPTNGTPIFSQMASITLGGTKTPTEVPESTKKIQIPELSKREPNSLRKVTQVSATGDLVERKRVQNAAYEAPAKLAGRTGARSNGAGNVGRVQLSHHEVSPTDPRQAFLGDDIADLPVDEKSVDELLGEDAAAEDADQQSTYEPEPAEQTDDEQTVRTYTIQVEN